jgi:uncharacterized membrane protein
MRVFATSRIVSLAVAASLVAPTFLEIHHAAVRGHVACPLDGRIEDVRDAAPGVPHTHSTGVLLPAASEERTHSHTACVATPAAQLRIAAATRSTDGLLHVRFARASSSPDDALRPAAVALYRVAPKLSPPPS